MLDSYPNMLSLSQNKMLKEAIEHMNKENQYLKDQLNDQMELVQLHKQMIQEMIKQSSARITDI